MSAGILDLSGFPVLRQDSTQVYSPTEMTGQASAAQQAFADQIKALGAVQTPTGMEAGFMAPVANNWLSQFQGAGINLGDNALGLITNALQNDFQNGSLEQAYASVGGKDNWDSWNRYYNQGFGQATNAYNTQVSGINQQAAAQAAADAKRAQEAEANRQVQQTAYNGIFGGDASGGGAIGGVLPTTTQTTGTASPTASTGASGFGTNGMMSTLGNGFGTGAVSNLGLGSAPTSQTGAMGGWGGPFSYRNPWSFGG